MTHRRHCLLPAAPLRRMRGLALAAIMAGVGLGGATGFALAAPSQACQRDALVVLSEVREARAVLTEAATGSEKERCAAWRNQAAALRKASAFYQRCQTGAERDRNVANANAGAAQYDNAAHTQCQGK